MSAGLDAFFARCEDVLDHWTPSGDAMVYVVGVGDEPEAQRVDSYYDQRSAATWHGVGWSFDFSAVSVAFERVARSMEAIRAGATPQWVIFEETHNWPIATVQFDGREHLNETVTEQSPFQRVIEARRSRNTGPAPRRLDGRRATR